MVTGDLPANAAEWLCGQRGTLLAGLVGWRGCDFSLGKPAGALVRCSGRVRGSSGKPQSLGQSLASSTSLLFYSAFMLMCLQGAEASAAAPALLPDKPRSVDTSTQLLLDHKGHN